MYACMCLCAWGGQGLYHMAGGVGHSPLNTLKAWAGVGGLGESRTGDSCWQALRSSMRRAGTTESLTLHTPHHTVVNVGVERACVGS